MKMKVLWFSPTPALFDEKTNGGWIGSLQRIVSLRSDVSLAIAFEYQNYSKKEIKDNVTYYPMNSHSSYIEELFKKTKQDYYWNILKKEMLSIVDDFQPDIIQCFGSEWPYGRIAEEVVIPVVIHMQGFRMIYNESTKLVFSNSDLVVCNKFSPKKIIALLLNNKKNRVENFSELSLMKVNKYFLGRTNWDKNITKYYSPGSKYYYCAEALRPEIYNCKHNWKNKENNSISIITISSANVLKGNEIILRTAKILKEDFNVDFTWRVAGSKDVFKMAERKTNIKHEKYNIELLGMIDAKSVANELIKASIYVHPAVIDNSPNSLCEAQVLGCPVIAANVGGIPQLVENGVSGILYPYNEPHTLAFEIMSLYKDKLLMNSLSVNEIQTARHRHDPKAICDSLIEIYTDVINNYFGGK